MLGLDSTTAATAAHHCGCPMMEISGFSAPLILPESSADTRHHDDYR
jgi:hypothetical protein